MLKNLLLLAGVYTLVLVTLYLDQRNLQYFPFKIDRHVPQNYGLDMQVVEIETEDGLVLRHWFRPPADNAPLIIYFHGNAGHIGIRASKTARMLQAGYGVLAVEYRGFGDNPGAVSETGLYKDADSVMRWVQDEGYGPAQIFLYGESLGGGIATEMATRYSVAGLILEAPFTSATDIAQSLYPYVPVSFMLKDRYENIGKIDQINTPLLIIHGQEDRIVPKKWGRRLYKAALQPKTFTVIQGADHNNIFEYGAFEAMHDFMQK